MKNPKTVLLVTTYPINYPIHGGQRRSKALIDNYGSVFAKACSAAIFNPYGYKEKKERGPYDIAAQDHTIGRIKKQPLLEDIFLGESCFTDMEVKARTTALLMKLNPQVIHIEQPYLYLGLKPLLKELGLKPKIIFGSQNIEYRMKAEIYKNNEDSLSVSEAKKRVAQIKNLETTFSKEADLVAAVSEKDLAEHVKMGAKNTVLAPNGIAKSGTTDKEITYWKEFFNNQAIRKTILFTGSAHPPNWSGFLTMVGSRLGFLPYDSKLMIVGDIGDALEYIIGLKDPYASSFWLRAHNCKRLSDNSLGALLRLCDLIVLPITEGGGSNLKTAEAILSGKKILATSYAFRSYEEFRNLSNVTIEDDPEKFRSKMAELLDGAPDDGTSRQSGQVESVTWPARLERLLSKVKLL